MYKLLLCWRYLRTRYLALVCVISVMLGVATLIVVNSVMAGFSTKLRERLHGILADVTVEALDFEGFSDPDEKMRRVLSSPAGQYVQAMTPAIETVAMLQYNYLGTNVTKMVRIIGVDAAGRSAVGGFTEYLFDKSGRPIPPSFSLSPEAQYRLNAFQPAAEPAPPAPEMVLPDVPPPPPVEDWKHEEKPIQGAFVGHAIVHFRQFAPDGSSKDVHTMEPGDTFTLICPAGGKVKPVYDRFALAGYFNSEMSEYDSNIVYVPLDHLQRLRGMQDRATCLQIKLTDYRHAPAVVAALREMFPMGVYSVSTWEDKQRPLLAAIDIERGILNVLLFLIVGVAGFGILAIFSMIVIEKTRDIGVLKALGASNRGIMGVFLGYGLLLGIVGAAFGTILGLTITRYLNEIEAFLSRTTGTEVFSRKVYYFDSIPTFVQTSTVTWINLGSIAIAAVFSVLPALKAARLQPVKALRFE